MKRSCIVFALCLAGADLPLAAAGRVDCDRVPDDRIASFQRRGDALIMNGVIAANTPVRLARMLKRYPRTKRIVLECVFGSTDDDANLRAARMVRAARLDTHVPTGGEIASGGTDFFLSGVRRTIGENVFMGVHAWAGDDGKTAGDFPRDHPEHRKYLDYYREMGIPAAFYWFTLKAASHDDVHDMTDAELERYRILTD